MRWAGPRAIERAVHGWAAAQRDRHPQVSRIFWYGSWVSGRPTPSSDVDLCVVLTDDHRRARDRIPDFLLEAFPVGMDLIVLTERELEEMAGRSPGWHRAITSGRRVA